MAMYMIFAVLLCFTAGYGIYRNRKIYRTIDRLLDHVLSREELEFSDVKEGELSALVHKLLRIQEVLGKQIEQAEEEKEQVKSLVSNMSHQLKTPLANLSVYTGILSGQELDGEKKAEAAEKMKRQIEKLDWIIGSLAKMVKLEQNVIVFDAEGSFIKKTILDAIDTVYEKVEKKGIHEEEITRIFKRFYRSREVEHIEGSGIGLYLSNLILEKEKGYMTVKSVYGEGSCFSVFLQNCRN